MSRLGEEDIVITSGHVEFEISTSIFMEVMRS